MARRINKKFLIIVTAVICCALLGAVALKYAMHHGPDYYAHLAQEQLAAGNLDQAAQNYGRAFADSHPPQPDYLIKAGDLLNKLAGQDIQNWRQAMGCWQKVLEIDPNNVPALQRLLTNAIVSARLFHNAQAISQLTDYATRLATADPSDKTAQAWVRIAPVQAYIAGVATDPIKLQKQLVELQKVCDQDPTNVDALTTLAQARLNLSQSAAQRNSPDEAEHQRQLAVHTFDNALKKAPDDPAVLLYAAQIQAAVSRSMELRLLSDQQMGITSETLSKADTDAKSLFKDASANVKHGLDLLKPTDEKYEDLSLLGAQLQRQMHDSAGAEATCKLILKNNPDSLRARLLEADVISENPAQLQQAIDVLAAPTSGNSKLIGIQASLIRSHQMAVAQKLIELRMQLYPTVAASKKPALLKQIEDGCTQLSANVGQVPAVLKLNGMLLKLQGKTVQAVQAMEKARAAYKTAGGSDPELNLELAQTYWQLKQTGQAQKLMSDVIKENPTYLPARLQLIGWLLDENDGKDAEPHVQFLERILPKDTPEVMVLRVRTDLALGKKDEAKSIYSQIPEKTLRQQQQKLQLALMLNDSDDAIRLLQSIHKQRPEDQTAILALVQLYMTQGQKDQALKVIDQAIAAKPDDSSYQVMKQQLLAATPQQRREIAEKAIADQSNVDPVVKELRLYNIARAQGDAKAEMQALDRAESLAPNDVRVLNLRYENCLLQHKWDQAEKYMQRLVKLNADGANGLLYQQQLALARGENEKAIDLAQTVIAKLPQFASGYLALGRALQAEERYREAIIQYRSALDRQSNNLEAMAALAQCYYGVKQPDNAYRSIQAGLQLDPDNPTFKEMQVDYSLKYGDGTLAIKARQQVASDQPDEVKADLNLGLAYLRAATYQIDQNQQSAAQPYIQKLTDLITAGMAKWPKERGFYALQGQLAIATKDYDTGLDAMNKMVAQPQWTDDPQTYLIVAKFYQSFHESAKAEAALRTCLSKGGGIEYRLILANFLTNENRPEEALKELAPLVETDQVDEMRAKILLAAHRPSEAEKILTAMLAKHPNSPLLQQQMMQSMSDQGKLTQLVTMTNADLAKNPSDVNALLYRGIARIKQPRPDYDSAMQDLKAVRNADPTNAEARFWLAEIYRQRNDWDSAINEIEQALSAQPNSKMLRLKLIDLDSTATPPRWSEVEQTIKDAQASPLLRDDPAWSLAAGDMWLARGNASSAIASYQAAIKLAPRDLLVFKKYIDALVTVNKPDQAIIQSNDLASNKDAPSWVHAIRAVAYSQMKQSDQAKAEIVKAVDAPDAVEANDQIVSLAQSAISANQVDAALTAVGDKDAADGRWQMLAAFLQHALHADGKAADLMSQALASKDLTPAQKTEAARWGAMFYMTATPPNYEKSISMTKDVLAADPDDMQSLNNLACMLVDSVKPSRPAEALKYSQHAYDLMLKSGSIQPLVQDTQGWVLLNNGRVQEATNLLHQVVDNNPFIDAYYHLAEAYLKQSRPLQAQQQLTLASQLLEDMKKKNQQFDATLPGKIEAATQAAKQMLKTQANAKP